MTFNFVPADCPAIWMRFVPAEEDKIATKGMIHTGMNNETITVDSEEKQAEEEVSSVAEDISENGVSAKGVGPHIRSVDEASQLRDSRLAEREYHRDCVSVGKEQADHLSDKFFDSLNLATTTDRGRDAAVVELRLSADQLGSRNDRLSPPLCGLDRMLRLRSRDDSEETSMVADRSRNNRLRCQKIDWSYCPSLVSDSDDLGPPLMMRTGPRRSDRVTSSQRSSNLNDDSNKNVASLGAF